MARLNQRTGRRQRDEKFATSLITMDSIESNAVVSSSLADTGVLPDFDVEPDGEHILASMPRGPRICRPRITSPSCSFSQRRCAVERRLDDVSSRSRSESAEEEVASWWQHSE
jgi:hypothetical protein